MAKGFKDPNSVPLLDITVLQQTKLWVDGRSVHRIVKHPSGKMTWECCPDFSCCNPELLTKPKSKRVEMWKKEIMRKAERA